MSFYVARPRQQDIIRDPTPPGYESSFRDIFTQLHFERVLGLSEAIGVACGLTADELVILKISASFHDIGKLGVPGS
ncbi:protein of unknown function [Georgfuchsia toluolica]|uniref:HD-GYP domain-containing protein n=1 Tax=Georgfuchsia toluolica TaxID=424218 RepID=A0A916MYZ2_9PROT|nr:protein of unknown function [Georgfuchsia toluolica]